MPPAKRFRPMMELSGGERTVAALLKYAAMLLSTTPVHLMTTG
jgi:chromosome segregation ATPase